MDAYHNASTSCHVFQLLLCSKVKPSQAGSKNFGYSIISNCVVWPLLLTG